MPTEYCAVQYAEIASKCCSFASVYANHLCFRYHGGPDRLSSSAVTEALIACLLSLPVVSHYQLLAGALYVTIVRFTYCNLIGVHCTLCGDSGYVHRWPDPLLLSEWVWLVRPTCSLHLRTWILYNGYFLRGWHFLRMSIFMCMLLTGADFCGIKFFIDWEYNWLYIHRIVGNFHMVFFLHFQWMVTCVHVCVYYALQ